MICQTSGYPIAMARIATAGMSRKYGVNVTLFRLGPAGDGMLPADPAGAGDGVVG
jgi:hypothetical protein